MSTSIPAPRALDHLVLPVDDLGQARTRLGQLGFTVAADARHPFGTENACVYLADGSYLEPLAVASREECEAAARGGNVFVARDQAFRFRRGEGFSALAVSTSDALADHAHFKDQGFFAGDVLEFQRQMRTPDGREGTASFRLAFAADLRAPDFYLFSCERALPAAVDRSALTRHANGAETIATVVLSEENPSDFQYLLEQVFAQREVNAHSFGIELTAEKTRIEVLTPEGLRAYYGIEDQSRSRGLRGQAVVFASAGLDATEKCLAANGVAFSRHGSRLVVPPAPGQGATFIFEDKA